MLEVVDAIMLWMFLNCLTQGIEVINDIVEIVQFRVVSITNVRSELTRMLNISDSLILSLMNLLHSSGAESSHGGRRLVGWCLVVDNLLDECKFRLNLFQLNLIFAYHQRYLD